MFHHISKHLEVRQKFSAARRIFNSLLGVWKCDEKRCLVFDILRVTRHATLPPQTMAVKETKFSSIRSRFL